MILPSPSESFEWVETPAGSALICRPLREAAVHVFTTREWRLASENSAIDGSPGWGELARVVGVEPERLMRVRQVHGATVAVGRRPPGQRPEADILLADDEGLSLAVQTADCVPLLLADRRIGVVAAVHAGWRGLLARAPAAAVAALTAHFGSRPIDLLAAIGPSIGACCYEVGADVRQRFARSSFGAEDAADWFLSAPARSTRNPSLEHLEQPVRGSRWFFDLWGATRSQLSAAGVPADQTFAAELCTASHPHVFCSHRREGAPAGRLAAAIRRRFPTS
jgi:YfiH family protein